VRGVLTSNEEEAAQDLKVMDKSTFMKSDVATVMKVLATLCRFADKGTVITRRQQKLARKTD
jgi:hypothetical protein